MGKLQDMQRKEYAFLFEDYDSAAELNEEDGMLLALARKATEKAYAPYSQFRVGAAARLSNGEFVSGANQENAAFPAGLCAEGVLLATASSLYPGVGIETLAVSYRNGRGSSDRPISPCGICRQSLQEFEQRTGRPVRLIMGGMEGKVYIVPQASLLLPLAFGPDELG
jgi:cytidine deaminase